MQRAIERWKEIVDARAQQMDAAYAQIGRSSANFWDRRAKGFQRATKDSARSDPFYFALWNEVRPELTLLDVGAGTGRFSLALAPRVKEVIAVEPNATMLHYLQAQMEEQKISNITCITQPWEAVSNEIRADIVICSHVLYPIREVDSFLKKLHTAARRSCFIYLRAGHYDDITAPFWKHFHGTDRFMPPGYIHALDVMYEMGLYANVEIARSTFIMRYPSLAVAVEELMEQLILPDREEVRQELHGLLQNWLIERKGEYCTPSIEMVNAILRTKLT